MDFFERQDRARRNTRLLVVYFAGGVIMLIASVYAALLLIFAGLGPRRHFEYHDGDIIRSRAQPSFWNPQLLLGAAAGTLTVIGVGSAFKTWELSRGGSVVATMLGGRPVSPATTDPDERKLRNIVEEMALAAGLPVPQVYVLPAENGINAFAAGHTHSDAVVAVTAGALRLLTRDELQGVIGHEFSHILNGDMRLNLRLMGLIFGILCLAVIGRILLQARSRSSRDRNPLPLLGLALLLIGWVGVFFGRLIQAAVSRQREFLADASAVQFTRNPAGLAGALKKIGGLAYGSQLQAAQASEASHLFFGNGVGESFLHWLDTHPPLVERIRALEPGFDGRFKPVNLEEPTPPATPAAPATPRSPIPFPFPGAPRASAGQAGLAPPVITAPLALAGLGVPTPAHLKYAEEWRGSIPESLRDAAREGLGASALVYALLLSDDEALRRRQLDELDGLTSTIVAQETLRLWPEVQAVAPLAKLPLVDLALPGLRNLSPVQFRQFRAAVQKLVESDGQIDLFEYVLQKIVLRHLEPHFQPARPPVIQYYSLKALAGDCAVLLSALAYLGHDQPDAIAAAFQQGAQPLGYAARAELSLLPEADCELAQVDTALNRLSLAAPQIKKNVLNACARTVAADGVIQGMEAELLRAIADTLDCPLPPFIPALAA